VSAIVSDAGLAPVPRTVYQDATKLIWTFSLLSVYVMETFNLQPNG